MSSFYANYGFHSRAIDSQKDAGESSEAEETMTELQRVHK
jgi:hypothetical protein